MNFLVVLSLCLALSSSLGVAGYLSNRRSLDLWGLATGSILGVLIAFLCGIQAGSGGSYFFGWFLGGIGSMLVLMMLDDWTKVVYEGKVVLDFTTYIAATHNMPGREAFLYAEVPGMGQVGFQTYSANSLERFRDNQTSDKLAARAKIVRNVLGRSWIEAVWLPGDNEPLHHHPW